MKKLIICLVVCLLVVGCGKTDTSDIKEKVDNVVKSDSYNAIVEKLDASITNIYMFPSLEYEDEFIYYVKAIKDNISRFSKDELSKIYDKLQIEYDFKYNSLSYNSNLFENDLDEIYNSFNKIEEDE